ncbi:MAG: PRTRC system protein C [Chloroflexi bacterium]|nr:PRTRC system protein C [Chloroflexota bacterium]
MTRIIRYQDQSWTLDNDAYTNEQARAQLAAHFPEVQNAEAVVTEENGVTVIEFRKRAGSLGAITAGDIVALLPQQPAQLIAAELLLELGLVDSVPEARYVELLPRLEMAQGQLERFCRQSARLVDACLKLRPAPASAPPVGF